MFFQSVCSRRISEAAASQSFEVASSSARAHSASFCGEVGRPGFLALGEIGVAPGEEPVARVAELLPGGLGVLARHRTDLLPLGLQLLQLVGGLDPVGGVGELLGAGDERELLVEIALALLVAVREELAQPGLDRIGGLPVAMPEGLRLGARRFGHALPALLDVVELARRLVEILFLRSLGRVEPVLDPQRFGLGNQLFLHGRVGEALPLVHLAQVVQLRRDHRGGGAQAFDQRLLGLTVPLDGGASIAAAQIADEPIRLAQRQVLGGAALLRALDQLLDALHAAAARPARPPPAAPRLSAAREPGLIEALANGFVQSLGSRHQAGPFGDGGRPGSRWQRSLRRSGARRRPPVAARRACVWCMSSRFWWRCRTPAAAADRTRRCSASASASSSACAERCPLVGDAVRSARARPRRAACRPARSAPHGWRAARRAVRLRPGARPRGAVAPRAPPRAAPAAASKRATAVGVELERRFGRERRPLAFGALQFRRRACRRAAPVDSTRATRLATFCCHASSASRRAASRFVQCLHHCPRPL